MPIIIGQRGEGKTNYRREKKRLVTFSGDITGSSNVQTFT